MPVLTELSIVQRKTKILEITRRMQLNPEEKLCDLCEAMGITERIYYYWIHEDPDMIETFRQMIVDISREELTSILSVRLNIIQRLILDAASATTSTGERLQVMRYLDERAEKLADKHRATGDESAREFLNGPTLRPAASRFSSSTVNIMPKTDGSVDVTVTRESEVVDAILKDITKRAERPEEKKQESFPLRLQDVDLNSLIAQRSTPSKQASLESGQ